MEEDNYIGEYVYVHYYDVNGVQMVYGGKLEKVILDEDNNYKILFSESYEANDEGQYRLFRGEKPIIKVLEKELYRGIIPQKKSSIKKFYNKVNRQIKEKTKKLDEEKFTQKIETQLEKERSSYKRCDLGFNSSLYNQPNKKHC